ncbi:predicted protein [Histoplasma mississippiense (nom. inval.)]|uniref:predicted protein n=1 Tax=Ajellomyces capsulatus (strain NAm1 / WU24) TaxID=2059318 RepID=UPI000157B95C|nr:predicted protein [Histoplasma mississippiense (nom. inval.)]EDN03576.1 predicted protein [Histoplasma mississippiense (nom. inval.)]
MAAQELLRRDDIGVRERQKGITLSMPQGSDATENHVICELALGTLDSNRETWSRGRRYSKGFNRG